MESPISSTRGEENTVHATALTRTNAATMPTSLMVVRVGCTVVQSK
jgi:hypothetical protein